MPRLWRGDSVNVEGAFTGRANLFASEAGILMVDRDAVDRMNRIDEAVTFATLPAFKAWLRAKWLQP